jgi:CheY-like chemotaxis protein
MNVKIAFIGDSPIMKVTEQVTKIVGVKVVDNPAEAQLVIAGSLREVEGSFDSNKKYVIISAEMREFKGTVPENVTVFGALFKLHELYQIIVDLNENENPMAVPKKSKTESISLLRDAKTILVIDDSEKNVISAQETLAGHKLTVVSSYEAAMEILGKEKFEIVLTDLYLPMSSQNLSEEAFMLGKLVPYGLLLRDEAARNGAQFVAVVTDLNHHADCFSAAFDHFSRHTLHIEKTTVRMLHAHIREDGSKNWKVSMEELLES